MSHELHSALKAVCLDFNGAFECFPFGPETTVFKVQASGSSNAKVFALLWHVDGAVRMNLKAEPAIAEQLRETYQEVIPGYHMNKRHWNSVVLPNGWKSGQRLLRTDHISNMIEDSYDLVVSALPKRDRLVLGWSAEV